MQLGKKYIIKRYDDIEVNDVDGALFFMLTIQTIKQPFTLRFAENLLIEGVTKH